MSRDIFSDRNGSSVSADFTKLTFGPLTNSSYQNAERVPSELTNLTNTGTEMPSSGTNVSPSGPHLLDLPEEIIFAVVDFLYELDVCRLAQTCVRLRRICDDRELWRRLFVEIFEYDRPLTFVDEERRFVFGDADSANPGAVNPWRESFRSLYRGLHVRPGHAHVYRDKPAPVTRETAPPAEIAAPPTPRGSLGSRSFTSFEPRNAKSDGVILGATSVGGIGGATEIPPPASVVKRPGRKLTHFETLSGAIESIQGTWRRYVSILSRSKGAKVPLIFVHAGKYAEDLPDIVCDLTIVGAATGETPERIRDQVVLESRSQCTVRFLEKSADSYLGYLTVRFLPEEFTEPQPRHWAILITGDCAPFIEYCRVRSISSYGAICHVSGENADPTIRNCDFSFGKNVGLYITNRAKGIYTNNRFSNNGLGIYCKFNSDPIVRSNDIFYNKQGGILISEEAVGYFELNKIFDNRVTGVEVKNEGNPVFIDNEIYGAQASGVIVYRQGQGQFLRNRIHDNADVGVFVLHKGIGLFEGNEIWSNRLAGIETRSGGSPRVVKCRVHGHGYGILLQESGHGNFFENDVFGNSKAGVFAHQGATGYLENNKIYKNAKAGVEIKDGAKPEFVNCQIYECKAAGVVIHNEGDGKFMDSIVRDNDFAGLFLFNGAKGHFENCVVSGNRIAGIDIKSGADPIVISCDIHSQEYGVVVHEAGKGRIVRNRFHDHNEAAVFTLKSSDATFEENEILGEDKQFFDLDFFVEARR